MQNHSALHVSRFLVSSARFHFFTGLLNALQYQQNFQTVMKHQSSKFETTLSLWRHPQFEGKKEVNGTHFHICP